MNNSAALVLFSGGQDSTTCLAWACETFKNVETIGFKYGQRHIVEMSCRLEIIKKFKKDMGYSNIIGKDHILDISLLGSISNSALIKNIKVKSNDRKLPNTFVPGRNLIFFTLAAALGYQRNIFNYVGGMCETDFSGYPDCRKSTLEAQEKALTLGLEKDIFIHTPLMDKTKLATWKLAYELGGKKLLNIIKLETHTCYLGSREILHEWGYGCDDCPACELRKTGFLLWKQKNENI